MVVSLALFGLWIAFELSGGPIGNYRTDWLAGVWAFAIGVSIILQIAAIAIAGYRSPESDCHKRWCAVLRSGAAEGASAMR
jgi:hypothetical protein